jgi:Tfp pilus assembly protein PilX
MNNLLFRSSPVPHVPRRAQQGVVLIISLIMLVILSMLATLSIRNASSSESVSGNVRTTLLASQAAEMALQHCEKWAAQLAGAAAHGLTDPVAPPTVISAVASGATPTWQILSTWDSGSSTDVYVVPLTIVNHNAAAPTYTRAPECMIEQVTVVNSLGNATATSTRVITARGFGPDETGSAKTRPAGSEVWMQSTIEFN